MSEGLGRKNQMQNKYLYVFKEEHKTFRVFKFKSLSLILSPYARYVLFI